MQYNNYIFDCDGVILDSNQFKLEAMEVALSEYPVALVKAFIQYFKNNFGKSRFHHIEVLSNTFLDTPLHDIQKERILQHYAEACKKLYLKCNICVDILSFLQTLEPTDCWVVSGSEQFELREVFKQRSLDIYFNEIYGSPTLKSQNINSLLQKHSLAPKETCLFGDSMGDYEAAKENNIDFIFCSKYSNTPELEIYFRNLGITVINTFTELL
jgi:phosphoglycolate phosphatase-like HAD superfamily hydrolase